MREQLDLAVIVESYDEVRGYPPYDWWMLTALLLYGYSRGVYSSRKLARGCEERLDLMAVNKPDLRTIADFRKRHLGALGALFVQVLELCVRAGLVKLGHVAVDGSKIKANASKHEAMSYGRMNKAEDNLAKEVSVWRNAAEAADAEEDAEHGADRRGDEMPDWVADKHKRLEKIRAAKAALEAEARAEAEEKAKQPKRYRGGRTPKTPPGTPQDSAQRNFTAPDSRIMKGRDGFIQGYNAPAAADGAHQIIVAHDLTANASDQAQLVPLVDGIKANTGRKPNEISADTGYCSEPNLEALEQRRIRAYLATGRQKHPDGGENQKRGPRVEAMRQTLRRAGSENRSSNRSSGRSSRPEASDNSSYTKVR